MKYVRKNITPIHTRMNILIQEKSGYEISTNTINISVKD